MNQVTAFWNPSVQDPDRIIRAARANPKGFFIKGLVLFTIPTLIQESLFRGDPEYDDIDKWKKDLFWMGKIPFGGPYVAVFPKPFLLGTVFSNIPRDIFNGVLDAMDDEREVKVVKDLKSSLAHAGLPGLIPTALMPVVEIWANWKLFFDRPVEPQSVRRLEQQDRFTHNTTDIARYLGQMGAKVGTGLGLGTGGLSPMKIEHLFYSWTGGMGRYALETGDLILRQFIERPEGARPLPMAADYPILRAFAIRHPTAATESSEKFYDVFIKVEAMIASHKKTVRPARKAELEANPLFKKHVGGTTKNLLRPTATKLAKRRREIRRIASEKALDAKRKRELINGELREMMIIAREAVKAF